MLKKSKGAVLVVIDWREYKEYKNISSRESRLEIAMEFFKGYYNITNPTEIFDSLRADDVGQMMLNKHGIKNDIDLENIILKM